MDERKYASEESKHDWDKNKHDMDERKCASYGGKYVSDNHKTTHTKQLTYAPTFLPLIRVKLTYKNHVFITRVSVKK